LRHAPGHLVDVVPTVMELVTGKPFQADRGAEAPRYPGRSLVPLFAKDGTVNRDSIWFLHEGNRALRSGDWKIVAAGADAPWELYNLAKDRAETRNLARENPDKLRELTSRWDLESAEYLKWAEKDAPPEPPAKAAKKKGKA
jgi:arylsulfatase A-like enzyme